MKYFKELVIILLNSSLFFLNFFFLGRILRNLESNQNVLFDFVAFLILFSLFLAFYFVTAIIIDLIFLQINVVLIFLTYIIAFNKLIFFDYKILLVFAASLALVSIFAVRVKSISKALVKIDLNKIYYFSQNYLFYFLIIMLGSFTYFRIEALNNQQKGNIIQGAQEEIQMVSVTLLTKSFNIKAKDHYSQALLAIFEKYYHYKPSSAEIMAIKASLETQLAIAIYTNDTTQDVIRKAVSKIFASEKVKFLNILSFAIAGSLISLLLILRPLGKIIDLILINLSFGLGKSLQIIRLNYSDVKKETISI